MLLDRSSADPGEGVFENGTSWSVGAQWSARGRPRGRQGSGPAWLYRLSRSRRLSWWLTSLEEARGDCGLVMVPLAVLQVVANGRRGRLQSPDCGVTTLGQEPQTDS